MVDKAIKRKGTVITLAAMVLAAAGSFAQAADLPTKAAPAAAPPPAPPFFLVNDNSISYSYEFKATNPGAGYTPKDVVTFSHFDVWAYGTNFINIDWLKATNGGNPYPANNPGTPAAPCDTYAPNVASTCAGYTEIYGLIRSTLGWNQLTNSKMFSVGPLTNIEFIGGVDANVDNTTLGSAKRSIQGGLQFDFAVPWYKGSIQASINAYKEWQNDGFAATFPFQPIPNPSGKVSFNPTWAVEALYVQPLGFLPQWLPLTFSSFAVIHGPKGCGETCEPLGPGLVRTTEYLLQQKLSLDVGQMVGGKPGMFSVFAAYRWWDNKFGITPNQPNGPFCCTLESTWIGGATVAF
jgi:hypothetical protein